MIKITTYHKTLIFKERYEKLLQNNWQRPDTPHDEDTYMFYRGSRLEYTLSPYNYDSSCNQRTDGTY